MVVQLVSPGASLLEARREQVDQPLGIAQLRRGHAIEVAMAEDVGGAEGIRRDHRDVRVGLVVDLLELAGADGGASRRPILPGLALLARGLALFVRRRAALLRPGGSRWLLPWQRQPARAPESVEHPVIDLAIVTPADEDRLPRAAHLLAIAQLDQGHRPREVDRGAQVDLQPGGSQLAPEEDGRAQQPAPVDRITVGRLDDGRIVHVATVPPSGAGQPPAAVSAR